MACLDIGIENSLPYLVEGITNTMFGYSILYLDNRVFFGTMDSVTRPIFGSCAAPKNLLGQPSQCLTILSNTRLTRHSPQLLFY